MLNVAFDTGDAAHSLKDRGKSLGRADGSCLKGVVELDVESRLTLNEHPLQKFRVLRRKRVNIVSDRQLWIAAQDLVGGLGDSDEQKLDALLMPELKHPCEFLSCLIREVVNVVDHHKVIRLKPWLNCGS